MNVGIIEAYISSWQQRI